MGLAMRSLLAFAAAEAGGPATRMPKELFAAPFALPTSHNDAAINNKGGLIFTFRCRIRHGVGLLSGGSSASSSALARPHRRAFLFRKVAVHVCEKPGNNPSSLATQFPFLATTHEFLDALAGKPPAHRSLKSRAHG
jgi:hypothetical protein